MTVEIIKDCTDIVPYLYEGSVLQDVKELKTKYKGLHCSMYGSYIVTVPKNRCKIIKDK